MPGLEPKSAAGAICQYVAMRDAAVLGPASPPRPCRHPGRGTQ